MANQFQGAITDPTVVTGARAVSDIVSTRVKLDVSDDILEYDPNANSLTLLSTKLRRKREVGQYQFYWLEKDRFPRDDAIGTTGYDADDTSIVVVDGTKFAKWNVVLNHRTKERFLVTAVVTNTLTAVRGLNSTAKAMNAGDKLEIIGNAYVEGGDVGTAKSVQERAIFNYTQQLRTPFTFTGRDMKTRMYGGSDPDLERRWQGVEHAISIEQTFWWGVRDTQTDSTSGKLITFSGGVDNFVTTNAWDLNAVKFNERNLTEALEVYMRDGRGGKLGRKTKYAFMGARYITEIETWAKKQLYYVPSDKIYGLDAMVYKSAHGRIFLIDHPLFDGENADKAFLLDLNHLRYVYHTGRDTKLLKDRGGNGVDGETEEYMSDVGMEVALERSHSKWFNLEV
jgi:hypothetical protein